MYLELSTISWRESETGIKDAVITPRLRITRSRANTYMYTYVHIYVVRYKYSSL